MWIIGSPLTGKTTAEFELSRLINVYIATTAAVIDSTAAMRVNWQATYKIGVNLSYSYDYRKLPGQGEFPVGSDRTDRLNIGQLTVIYKPLSWLTLQPYFQYQSLASAHDVGVAFNSRSTGIEFTAQWDEGVMPTRTPLFTRRNPGRRLAQAGSRSVQPICSNWVARVLSELNVLRAQLQ